MPAAPTTIVGVSTKAYLGWRDSLDWVDRVHDLLVAAPLSAGTRLFVVPSFPVIPAAVERLAPLGVIVGAQNVAVSAGALTGEVSAGMLRELGVGIVEVGHAERRSVFQETDDVVRTKLAAVLAEGMTPLLCVGEPDEGDPVTAAAFCADQIASAIAGNESRLAEVIVAYEPVWAIGAAEPAPVAHIVGVVAALRRALADRYATSVGQIIYGGSAGPGLLAMLPSVDGLFLGRFAHNPANLRIVLDEAEAR